MQVNPIDSPAMRSPGESYWPHRHITTLDVVHQDSMICGVGRSEYLDTSSDASPD
jgi:hypothetical protein